MYQNLYEALNYQKNCWRCDKPFELWVRFGGYRTKKWAQQSTYKVDFEIEFVKWALSPNVERKTAAFTLPLKGNKITMQFPGYSPAQSRPRITNWIKDMDTSFYIHPTCSVCKSDYVIVVEPDTRLARMKSIDIPSCRVLISDGNLLYSYEQVKATNTSWLSLLDRTTDVPLSETRQIEDANYDLSDPNLLNHLKTELLFG